MLKGQLLLASLLGSPAMFFNSMFFNSMSFDPMSSDLSEHQVSSSSNTPRNNLSSKAGFLPVLAAALLPASCVSYRDEFADEARQKAIAEALYAKMDLEIAREVELRLGKAVRNALSGFTHDELYSLVHEAVVQVVPNHQKSEEQHLAKSVADEIMGRIAADNRLSVALASWQKDPQILRRTMLEPTVQISIGSHVGSGVILRKESIPNSDKYQYHILSCWHTFREEIDQYEKQLRESATDEARANIKEPLIEVKAYVSDDAYLEKAKIIFSRADKDLSLLVMSSALDLPVANFSANYRESKLQVFSPVIAVGCPLGNDPMPTLGIVSDMAQVHEGFEYMMTTAATHIGNSGGPIYSLETGEIEAIVSKVYMSGRNAPSVVSHMGLAVPRVHIYDFLKESAIFK